MNGSLYFDCESGCRFNEALSAFTMSYGVVNLLTSVPPCAGSVCVLPSFTDGIDLDSGDLADIGVEVIDASRCEKLKFVSLTAGRVKDKIRLVMPRKLSDLRVLMLSGVKVKFNSAEMWLDTLALDWYSEVSGLGTVHFGNVAIDGTVCFRQDSLVFSQDFDNHDNIPSISAVYSSPRRLSITSLDPIQQLLLDIKSDTLEELNLFGSVIMVVPLIDELKAKNLRVLNLEAREVRENMHGYGREVGAGEFGNRLLFGSDKLKEINIRAEKIDSVDERSLRECYREFGVSLSVTRV